MRYSDEIIEEVRSANDIVDVISGYVQLKKKGSSYMGLCPFHNEKTGSFSVMRDRQMYHCFGCGVSGTVYTFLMQYDNQTFPEAIRTLADRAGIRLPEQGESAEEKKKKDVRTKLLEINRQAATFYYCQLRNEKGKIGMDYFKNRGLSDDTMRSFGLGYASKYSRSLTAYLKNKGFTEDLLLQSGLVGADEKHGMYDKFFNRVMFPIMDRNGKVIGFGGRVLGDGLPKYLNSPETMIFEKSKNLYGLHVAKRTKEPYFLLCEGYMDVISLHQAGFTNAVASLGTSLTTQHAMLLKRYTKEVILTYDSDGAGVKAALRAIPMLKAVGISVRVLNMKPYKDPDEFIKNLGREAYEERIRQASDSFLFEVSVLENDYNMQEPGDKARFFREVGSKLDQLPSQLERDLYRDAVAAKYGIAVGALSEQMRLAAIDPDRARRRQPDEEIAPKRPFRTGQQIRDERRMKPYRLLIGFLVSYPKLYEPLKGLISLEDFEDPFMYSVAALLFDQLQNGTYNPASIVNRFEDPKEQEAAASLLQETVRTQDFRELEKAVVETVTKIRSEVMQRQILKKTEGSAGMADPKALQNLIMEKKRLQEIGRLQLPPELFQREEDR